MVKWPPKEQMVIGIHPIRELLLHAPERILALYTSSQSKGRKGELIEACEAKKIPIHYVKQDELTEMAHSDSHQSFGAHVKGRNFLDVKQFLEKMGDREEVFVLLLDQIFDPQNFGALLRSAECFGVDGVVWSKNRGADLTPLAAKTSSGASEWLNLIRISNLATAVEEFQKEGYEVVVSLLKTDAKSAFEFRYPAKTVLILGSEGEGVQPLLQKRADHAIYIPMQGKIGSLNVAQAAAVLLSCRFRS